MKTQLILTLYDKLIDGGKIDRKLFCVDEGISERTFYRYMREINVYIMHSKRNMVLNVDEPVGIYYLEKLND